jgi:hypothetical protein
MSYFSPDYTVNVTRTKVTEQLATLTEAQLDELTTKIFEWQQLDRLVDWLKSLPTEH